MAEIAGSPGMAGQIALVMLVRWQAFRNGLRSRSEKLHLVGTIAGSVPFVLIVLIASPAIGFVSYAIAKSGKWLDLSLVFWLIFLFWQFTPLLTAGLNPGFDGRNLLRFPLRFSTFFVLSTAYGLADPYAAIGILWHAVAALGICVVRPDLTGWTILAVAISILMNLLFSRLLFAWLERALSKRLLREIVTALMVLAVLGFQFANIFFLRRSRPALLRTLRQNAEVWSGLPPALPGAVLQHAAAGETGAALRTAGLLAIYPIAFAGFFALRLRAQFAGEDLEESPAPVPLKTAVKSAPAAMPAKEAAPGHRVGAWSGIVSAPAAAIFVKEVRYFYRNSILLLNVVTPLILIAFFTMSSMPGRRAQASSFARFGGEYAYPAAVAYVLLLTSGFFFNNLAYEGHGIERLFLAPMKFRDVMLGKNLFHGAFLALEALLALAVISLLGHAPRPQVLLATWTGLLFAGLIHLGAGNWVSIQFPRRFAFGVRRQRAGGLTGFIALGVFFGEMAIIVATAYICISRGGMWLLPAVYWVMSAGAFEFYRIILNGTTRQALLQRDALLEQLSR